MNYWKILGGVAVGIATVVALPVAGAVGTITVAGAAAAAAAGAVGGAACGMADSKAREKEKEKARKEGEKKATAKYQNQVDELLKNLQAVEKQLRDDMEYFQLLIALFAVGMATASADGQVSVDEMKNLEEFVAGIGALKLPPHVKGAITKLKNKPPSFNTAMQYVKKLNGIDMALFESVIKFVSRCDGKVCAKESALLEAFRQCAA